jgi:hypothetical protein
MAAKTAANTAVIFVVFDPCLSSRILLRGIVEIPSIDTLIHHPPLAAANHNTVAS